MSDVMEDMLAMVSTSGSPGAEQDVEPVAQRSYPQTQHSYASDCRSASFATTIYC